MLAFKGHVPFTVSIFICEQPGQTDIGLCRNLYKAVNHMIWLHSCLFHRFQQLDLATAPVAP